MGKSLLGYWESGVTYTMAEAKQRIKVELVKIPKFEETDITGRYGILFLGHAGIGKTSILRQAALECGADWWTTQVGGNVVEDNHGLQTVIEGQSRHAVAAHMAGLFQEPKCASRIGLALWDEVASGDKMHQNDVRFMIDGRLDENSIHSGWRKFACSNPPLAEYSTVSDIDQALLERFKVIVLKPSDEEKLQHWAKSMQPTIYKFLLTTHLNTNKKFNVVDKLSPRVWCIIADGVERVMKGCNDLKLAEKEVRSETDTEIGTLFTEYMRFGNDPDRFPIACKELVNANKEQLKELMDRVGRWISGKVRTDAKDAAGNPGDALIGATKWDIVHWISDVENHKLFLSDKAKATQVADNLARFIVDVGSNNRTDLAQSMITVLRKTPLIQRIVQNIRGTKLETKFTDLYAQTEEAKKEAAELSSAVA